MPGLDDLKSLLLKQDEKFWSGLATLSSEARSFEDLLFLSTLRKKALARKLANPTPDPKPLRLALIGGYSLYPLSELLEHLLSAGGFQCQLFSGDFDNYAAEILGPTSALYEFKPDLVMFLPGERSCRYTGELTDSRELQGRQALDVSERILGLCRTLNARCGAEVILSNFVPPTRFDPGPYRAKTLGSDWSFRKLVNLELGLGAPSFVHICDAEFLACRRGLLSSRDDRAWFESKQPGAPDLLVDLAREVAQIASSLRKSAKKVLVLDLDNTLWGGVIGDDGLEGIELGDTSPRGEAFKAFQKYVLSLSKRGILLAVCSKNDHDKAVAPFEKHPEMVLKREHIVSFKANWNPKSDNIRDIAAELNLGVDSLVFVDDNPAEIEIVRQFVPEVATLLLGPDPSDYVGQLQDARHFEPAAITREDLERTEQYRQEAQRNQLRESVTDMGAYLQSLGMVALIREFTELDTPRISQLINKSNQFNLTTRRRTEAEVRAVASSPAHVGFTVRLEDRFGDHGLIAVVICEARGKELEVDTWLMSCRVLKRQVEELTVNEIVRHARARGCERITGVYLPSEKNGMVADLYPKMGFAAVSQSPKKSVFELKLGDAQEFETSIQVKK